MVRTRALSDLRLPPPHRLQTLTSTDWRRRSTCHHKISAKSFVAAMPSRRTMALRIDCALSMTAEAWLALQRLYDPDRTRATIDVSRIDPLVATGGS